MISLVTATLGRTDEFSVLLESLSRQTYKNFELIIVDQNDHHKLESIIAQYPQLKIKYIRSNVKGLSYNRNIGLKFIEGDVIGFPDDDCFYDDNVLKTVAVNFDKKLDLKLIAFNVKDPTTKETFISGAKELKRSNLLKSCISYNLFIRRDDNIFFDERLGIGAKWGAGEETDYIFEYFKLNDRGLFVNDISIFHKKGTAFNVERAYKYGLGMGALFKKEIITRKHYNYIFQFLKLILRPLGGIICLPKSSKIYWYTFLGRLNGFFSFPID